MCDTDIKYTALESEQQVAVLKVFEPLLKVRLIPTTMLLHLTDIFSFEVTLIKNQERQNGQAVAVHSLVELLLGKSDEYRDWFRVFMDALRDSGNGHIAEIIKGTCVSSMDELENYKRHIELFAPHLEVINPAEILPELTSILSDHDREQIKADQRNHGPRYAVLTLLDRLVKKTGDWFKDFLQALRNVGRDDLANLLHNPQATQRAVRQRPFNVVEMPYLPRPLGTQRAVHHRPFNMMEMPDLPRPLGTQRAVHRQKDHLMTVTNDDRGNSNLFDNMEQSLPRPDRRPTAISHDDSSVESPKSVLDRFAVSPQEGERESTTAAQMPPSLGNIFVAAASAYE
ncbi:uncharacterized protein [Ptychodera flava]|uniref:uncharacterized protein isoform X3 n=1 Tax=Ptychodera flava TaxID=63121 RepID=UPI003969E4F4